MAIENVDVGDRVLARSDTTGEFDWKPVIAVFETEQREELIVRIENPVGQFEDYLNHRGTPVLDIEWMADRNFYPRFCLANPLFGDYVAPRPGRTSGFTDAARNGGSRNGPW